MHHPFGVDINLKALMAFFVAHQIAACIRAQLQPLGMQIQLPLFAQLTLDRREISRQNGLTHTCG